MIFEYHILIHIFHTYIVYYLTNAEMVRPLRSSYLYKYDETKEIDLFILSYFVLLFFLMISFSLPLSLSFAFSLVINICCCGCSRCSVFQYGLEIAFFLCLRLYIFMKIITQV